MKQIFTDLIAKMENKRDSEYTTCHQRDAWVQVWSKAIVIVKRYARMEEVIETATGGNQLTRFDGLVRRRINKIQEVLMIKGKEYTSDDDCFHNFKTAGRMESITPEQALKGMMLKHEVSVKDLINSPEKATQELIDEKIGDNINYLILLEGLLTERINKKEVRHK